MKKIAITLLFAWCIFVPISEVNAQELIKGKVLSVDKMPVQFANVYWLNTTIGTTTDTLGNFAIEATEESRKLVISSVGFSSDTISVSNSSKFLTIELKNRVELEEVEVTYRKKGTEISFMNKQKIEQIGQKELKKAACCNLSESFETIPSIDASFTDALTGTKQIRMLGLDGSYAYISRENMPGIRGLSNAYGLSFVPGTWIESIQLSKGVGTVMNGYESIAGQINVELKKPDVDETFFNVYFNESGRTEFNFNQNLKVNKNWSTMLLLHGSARPLEVDQNNDGFLDFPTGNHVNVMNRWKYSNNNGLEGQLSFQYLEDEKIGGQKGFDKNVAQAEQNPYGLKIETERFEVFGKLGYVFQDKSYKSMGLQAAAFKHTQRSNFGFNTYNGTEESIYLNYLYRSIIKNEQHEFTTGASYLYDAYQEEAFDSTYNRTEKVPGVFLEYTYAPSNNFSIVGGLRADFNSIYGSYLTPRLHSRWAVSENTVIRTVAGSGQRTANIFAEYQAMFATSRAFNLLANQKNLPFGLKQEKAYNFGINLTKNFSFNYRDGYFGLDFYHIQFENQVVYDIEQAQSVSFYNLEGKSFSNSFQAEINYELIKFLDVKLAYRFLDVKIDYLDGLKQKPLTARHRIFSNFAYETATSLKGALWKFDLTVQYLGEQRIPSTQNNIEAYRRSETSDGFMNLNAQVTRVFNEKWEVYLGAENLTNFRQDNPVIAADSPFGPSFDSSLIWGPIFGRMFYVGARFVIAK